MTEDITPTPRGEHDIEARLRHALVQKAGDEPFRGADWGDLAGRLASSTRRRQRVLAGAAGLALVVGAVGGYLGEAAAAPGPLAARAPGSKSAGASAPSGGARPSGASAGAMAACPDESGGSSASSSTDIGSATRLFIRTTADGVTVRVYQDNQHGTSCIVSPPGASGTGTNSPTGSTGATGATGATGSPGSGSTLMPLLPAGKDVTIEMSDADAVGQGAIEAPQCVTEPGGDGAGSGSNTGAGSGVPSGTSPTPPNEGGGAPVVTPDIPATTTPDIPATTTTVPVTTPTPSQPSALVTGTFGVSEGDPVWWVAVEVASDVSSVRMTFPDGAVDQMAPVDGTAVLAHRVATAVATAATGPYEVRGSLQLLGADGSVLDTVTLPQASSAPVPVPLPASGATPLEGGTKTVTPGVIVVCPPSTAFTPQAQSSTSTSTEKR